MTTPLSVFTLFVTQTADEIFDLTLAVARVVGLPVDTWRTGDPTRTQFRALAEGVATRDQVQQEFAKGSFLATATGDHLTLRAADVYGVEREEATFAAPSITLDNAGGGQFEIDVGGLVVSSPAAGATFTNQAVVSIASLETGVVVSLVAQSAGSAGTVAVDDIDTIVSPTMTGVSIVSSTAAIGADAQSDQGLSDQCLATLGALSPDGPADAYEFVARNSALTGIVGVTRALADGDNPTGEVTVYVATATAALDAPSVAAIQLAVDEWATPLCTLATVVSMTPLTQAVTLNLTPNHPELQDSLESAIDVYFAGWDGTNQGGVIARDALASVVRAAADAIGVTLHSIAVTTPATDTAVSADRFPVRGTLTLT